ncbi:MAG: hypothetical protein OEW75_02490 [Cyclobacteriaceae bacterium]|nr:hypothetical protein [Cyclobacteriaceae bacterium]
MARLITLVLLFVSLNSFGQLPAFESNVLTDNSSKSLIQENFSSDFEYIISYHGNSYWSGNKTYYIFGHDGQKWQLIRWTFKFNEQKQPIKQRLKRLKFSQDQFAGILTLMSETNFYNLKQELLNLNEKDNGDGTIVATIISDGGTDNFELISPQSHRKFSAYAADILQEQYPTSDRQTFISCRNKILKLIYAKS